MSVGGEGTLPGLPIALDTEAFRVLLGEALAREGEELEVLDIRVVDVRYRPDRPCWILYKVKGRDARGRTVRTQLSGQLSPAGMEPIEPSPNLLGRYRECGIGALTTPVLKLDEPEMAVFAYPLDTALPGLFGAASPKVMKEDLGRLWRDRRVRVRRVSIRQLGYTPHARAAFDYEVLGEGRRTGAPELRRLIGKMHAKKPAPRLFADAWAVWRESQGRIGLAPPVGFLGTVGMTLQERVRGVRLGGLVDQPGFVSTVRRTAQHLARLHGLQVPLSSRRKLHEELKGIHRWAGILSAIRPELKSRVATLRDRLSAEVEGRIRLTAPTHADFHHTNVLVEGDRITIIDLDEMAFGDPMVDVGRFLASLRVPARRAFGRISALDEAGEAFLAEYLRHRADDEGRARLFEACSLLIAAGSSFRIQREGWEEEVHTLLDEVDRVLALSVGKASVRVGESTKSEVPAALPDGRPELDREARARFASDGLYLQACLAADVKAVYGAVLDRCRVVKPPGPDGSGEARYELRGRREGETWKAHVTGLLRDTGGLGLSRRLDLLREALEEDPQAPLLPRPVSWVRTVGLLVWEPTDGPRLSSLVGTGKLEDAAARLGGALASLHAAPVDLGRKRSLEIELRAVERKVHRLRARRPALGGRAGALFAETAAETRAARARLGPSLRIVHPRHVLCPDGRVAMGRLDDLVVSHPLLDLGDAVARLHRLGLEEGHAEETRAAASRLRSAYGEGSAIDEIEMGAFEALALVRAACRSDRGSSGDGLAEGLLDLAERRLAASVVS